MNQGKVAATAKKLDTLFKVLRKAILICMAAAVCVMLALTAVNIVNPEAVIGKNFHLVDIGSVTVELAEAYTPDNGTILIYAWVYVALMLVCAAVVYLAMGYIRKILQPMTEGAPFQAETAVYIKKLAYTSLGLGVAANVGVMAETFATVHYFGLSNLAETGVVRSITANYTFDLTFIVGFLVLMLMSYIFSYGAELQQLSDETL